MTRQATVERTPERRLDVRYVGPIGGCYALSKRRDLDAGGVEVFACRTQSISSTAVAITAPVAGAEGDLLTARFDGIGILRGTVSRITPDGFVFQIVASDDEKAKLAAKIDWLKKKSVRLQQDERSFKRFQPRDPRSTLALADGSIQRCFVIDLSRGGAAVSAKAVPPVGSAVVVGKVAARVIRHLDVGFAVQFDAEQPADQLERLVTGHELVASTPVQPPVAS